MTETHGVPGLLSVKVDFYDNKIIDKRILSNNLRRITAQSVNGSVHFTNDTKSSIKPDKIDSGLNTSIGVNKSLDIDLTPEEKTIIAEETNKEKNKPVLPN